MGNFSVINKTQGTQVSVPFENIKNGILGRKYNLSLVFIGDAKSKTLNKKYRNKNYSTNILSFPLDKENGEIFINKKRASKEAKKNNVSGKDYIAYLFIHGLLHLDGHKHGSTMEKEERKWSTKFKVRYPFE